MSKISATTTVSCRIALMLTAMTASNGTEILNSQIVNAPFSLKILHKILTVH